MILKPNDILKEGDVIHYKASDWTLIVSSLAGNPAMDSDDLANPAGRDYVERPDPTAEEIFSGIQAEAALRRISDTPLDELQRWKRAYMTLFKLNDSRIARIEEGDRQLDELAGLLGEQTDKIRYLEAQLAPQHPCKLDTDDDEDGAIWPANQEDYKKSAREFSNRQNKRQEDKDTAWEHLRDARKEMLSDDEDSPASERAREAGWLGVYEHPDYCIDD